MNNTAEIQVPKPVAGQQYADGHGRRWLVIDVQQLGVPGRDYYVLNLDFRAPDTRGARFRMSSQEFYKLATTGELKPLR
jgi:hypothetical protein